MPQKSEPSAERARAALLADREPSNDDLAALVAARLEGRSWGADAARRPADPAPPAPAPTEQKDAEPAPQRRRRSPLRRPAAAPVEDYEPKLRPRAAPRSSRLGVRAPRPAAMERRARDDTWPLSELRLGERGEAAEELRGRGGGSFASGTSFAVLHSTAHAVLVLSDDGVPLSLAPESRVRKAQAPPGGVS